MAMELLTVDEVSPHWNLEGGVHARRGTTGGRVAGSGSAGARRARGAADGGDEVVCGPRYAGQSSECVSAKLTICQRQSVRYSWNVSIPQ